MDVLHQLLDQLTELILVPIANRKLVQPMLDIRNFPAKIRVLDLPKSQRQRAEPVIKRIKIDLAP